MNDVPYNLPGLPPVERALNRILGEFKEMPGMSLTLQQASRLFGVPEAMCLRVLIRLTTPMRSVCWRWALLTDESVGIASATSEF